jgi:hypothetical protein
VVYHVGCKVRLKIRLDQQLGITPPALSATTPDSGSESFGSGSIDDIIAQAAEFITVGQDFSPESCTVEINNYRKADTAKLSFPLSRLPVDPRLIRAMSVQVFGGTFTPAEYAAGVGPQGAPGVLLPDSPSPLTGEPDSFGGYSNEVFRGFADKYTIKISGDSTIEIECRDITGELLDAEIPPDAMADLPSFLRLDEVVQLLLTGDGLANVEQDKRLQASLGGPSGRKRKRLLADARASLSIAAELEAAGDPEAAALARIAAAAIKAEAQELKAAAAGLPPRSRRFGLPGFRGIKVVNEVRDPATGLIADLPTLDEIRPKAWVDSSGKARKGRKRGAGGKQKISYWDFVADMVTSAGYIVFVRVPRATDTPGAPLAARLVAAQIVISNPRTYYREATDAGDTATPPSSVRSFVLGVNAETVELTRNLKGVGVPTIQVGGFDSTTGLRYVGVYPPLAKNNRPAPTGDGDRDEIKVFNLDQVTGGSPEEIVANLTRAAAGIYEQLGRGDFELTIGTKTLSARPENVARGTIADLFSLRPKDPIGLELPAQDPTTGVVSSGLILAEASVATRIRQARHAGLDEGAARKIGFAAASQYIQREFRTSRITMIWSENSGWEMSVGAINYLDVRDSIQITDAQG